uniref:Uncharacterized protein n=1 Tax=Triticum urartu TaxID=4572 RepID=A0A8R7V136_TRIUA
REPGSQNRVKLRQRVIGRDRGRPMQAKRRVIRYQVYKKLLDLSGILTVFFCGIVMSHYTWHNVTERVTTK